MPKTVVIDNEFVTLWYYPEEKIVHHQIHKFIFGEPLHQVLLKVVELFEKDGAHKWLSDDRNNGPLSPEDVEWSNVNWLPRAQKAGWKYWAMVMPEKAIGQMNMARFQTTKGAGNQRRGLCRSFASLGVAEKRVDVPHQAYEG